jgi:Membrane protein putatively involved in post-translational modification of the autoinducing quorum-sensing peptide
MRFIRKWSYACATQLAVATNENHQRRSVYYYGFYIVIGALFKLIVLTLAAILTRTLLTTFILFFVFGSLRMFAGGVHMDSFNKCMIVSFALYISGGVLAEYTGTYWNNMGLYGLAGITLICGIYILFKYAPKDTPNKPITDPNNITKFKRLSLTYFFVLIILILVLIGFSLKKYCIAVSFGILFELFTITPVGHKFFNHLSENL